MRSLCLLFSAAAAAALDCSRSYPGPKNANFETVNLQAWTVLSGDAFGDASVSDSDKYSDGPFHQNGKYFLWGYQKGGDGPVGKVRSSTFQASSVMSFLVGGGYSPDKLYVGLVRESDGKMLLKQTGMDDEALIRIMWDTSAWAGENVYMVVVDEVAGASWGHINLDDVRVGCEALGDGDLTFTVMGQANQPTTSMTSQNACQLYAADQSRPQYHYTPYQGWINDPCGLILWRGQHHRFSQSNPLSAEWGAMQWSHTTSKDGVHLQLQDVALHAPYPYDPSDISGRFTGSAVQDPGTGDLRVIFTESTDTNKHPGAVPEEQWTASSEDGLSFDYYPANPIVAHPPPHSGSGFRDPKVFFNDIAKVWQMVVGSGDSKSGKVHLYEAANNSTDLTKWDYVGVAYEGDGSEGTMYECPNLYRYGDKWILIFGANGKMIYHVGSFNGTVFTSELSGLVDHGPAGYAGQVYKGSKGQNLLISWLTTMGGWKVPSRVNGWVGSHSFTKELFVNRRGRLGSRPLYELQLLKTSEQPTSDGPIQLKDKQPRYLGRSNSAWLQFGIDLSRSTAKAITIRLFASGAEEVKLTFTVEGGKLSLDTRNAGYGQAGVYEAADVDVDSGDLNMQMLLDRSTLEIFTSDGTTMSANIFPKYKESRNITIEAEGGDVLLHAFGLSPLGSAWC